MSASPIYHNNIKDIRGDGRVTIYQRPRRDGSISPIWHMRISLPNSTGYHKQSTKTASEPDATRIALNKFDELYIRVAAGSPLKASTFKDVAAGWERDYRASQPATRKEKHIRTAIGVLKKYPYEFFVNVKGNVAIEHLDDRMCQEYFSWRRENSFLNGRKFVPAEDTLRKEQNLIVSLLTYAHNKHLIREIPKLNAPIVKDNRRPPFSADEWKKLYTAARKWVNEAPSEPVKRDRFYLQHLILILTNSGMRIGEARELRWGNLETIKTAEGKRLKAVVSGKTGERDVVMMPDTQRYFERIYDHRKAELYADPQPSDFVFCHKDGREIGSFKKSFASLLEHASLTYNARGQKRTIYSLRHTYATFRLGPLGKVSVYDLAKNMGTSVAMLQRFYGQEMTEDRAVAVTQVNRQPAAKSEPNEKQSYPFR